MINFLAWLVMGAVAGWLASLVMKTNRSQGLFLDIIVGIIGAYIGGFIMRFLGVGTQATGLNLPSILVAFVGSVVLLGILRLIRR